MGTDWESILGTRGANIADAYDEAASDALYQDHPSRAPQTPVSEEPEEVKLPFEEE